MKRNESLKNFKNYCFWYSQANPNYLHPEVKCKYGVTCKYQHLTENEVDFIKEKGNRLIDCFYCKSNEVFYLESINGRENFFPCPYNCKNGKIRLIEIILQKSKSRERCRCISPSMISYRDQTISKFILCEKCNCIYGKEI